MGINIGNMLGVAYKTMTYSHAKSQVIGTSKTIAATDYTSNTKTNAKLTGSIKPKTAVDPSVLSVGTNQKEHKTGLAVNYTESLFTQDSKSFKSLVDKYNGLKTSLSTTGNARLAYDDADKLKYIEIGKNYIKSPDGKAIGLTSDELTQALKDGLGNFTGTANITVSKVKSFTYVDENGITQTHKGFTIIEGNYQQNSSKELQSFSFVIDNEDDSDFNNVQIGEDGSVTNQFSVSGEDSKIVETVPDIEATIQSIRGFDAYKIYRDSQDRQLFLTMVESATSLRPSLSA